MPLCSLRAMPVCSLRCAAWCYRYVPACSLRRLAASTVAAPDTGDGQRRTASTAESHLVCVRGHPCAFWGHPCKFWGLRVLGSLLRVLGSPLHVLGSPHRPERAQLHAVGRRRQPDGAIRHASLQICGSAKNRAARHGRPGLTGYVRPGRTGDGAGGSHGDGPGANGRVFPLGTTVDWPSEHKGGGGASRVGRAASRRRCAALE